MQVIRFFFETEWSWDFLSKDMMKWDNLLSKWLLTCWWSFDKFEDGSKPLVFNIRIWFKANPQVPVRRRQGRWKIKVAKGGFDQGVETVKPVSYFKKIVCTAGTWFNFEVITEIQLDDFAFSSWNNKSR